MQLMPNKYYTGVSTYVSLAGFVQNKHCTFSFFGGGCLTCGRVAGSWSGGGCAPIPDSPGISILNAFKALSYRKRER